MACHVEVTSQIIPVYSCYPHSVSNQDALLYLLKNPPHSAQKLYFSLQLWQPTWKRGMQVMRLICSTGTACL